MKDDQKQDTETNPFAGRKYIRALGRRKSAVAVVKIFNKGKGIFLINQKKAGDYFSYPDSIEIAESSLDKSGKKGQIDISIRVNGGGTKSQAEAIRLAIARALILGDESLKKLFRKAGFITVDSRVKERKKPGLKRARRAPQWSKR